MSSFYGGTVTAVGRELITSLLAGETIEFTKVLVGSGSVPDGAEPIDMTDLAEPVAEGVSTVPVVENSVMYMTVEYRNDLNGGLKKGFWLREFGVYARTESSEEVLLYYATLGDSPQPVNAYKDNRVDVRRYPISIALEVDAEVEVTYNPGAFITSEDAEKQLTDLVNRALVDVLTVYFEDLTIPREGWELVGDDGDGYPYQIDVACEPAKEDREPRLTIHKESLRTAKFAGMCPTIQTREGSLRFWSETRPDGDMTATVSILAKFVGVGEGGGIILPPASSTVLGAVKVKPGSGLNVGKDGSLSIDAATKEETEGLYNGEDGAG